MNYIQIDRTNCMEMLLDRFPAFQAQWDLHLAAWTPTVARPIALDIAEFADFTLDTICNGVDADLDRIAATLELILLQGDAVIEYTFRSMFLEQIAHRSHRGGFPIDRFICKLQPLGYYHWQALDRRLGIDPLGFAIEIQ
jgi:hypothetical protein